MIYSWHLTMKKTIIILAAFLFSEILCAQTPADYIIRARALTKSGKAEEAVRLLSEAVRIHNDSRLYCEKAEAEIATGDLSAAIADFNTANSIEQYSENMAWQVSMQERAMQPPQCIIWRSL